MKKLLIYLLLTAFCCAGAYADGGTTGGDDSDPPSIPPTQPGPGQAYNLPSMAPFSTSSKNTAPQITYAKGYISVYTLVYQNVIVCVQASNGTVLYQNAMTENLLVIDTRNWKSAYTVVILNK